MSTQMIIRIDPELKTRVNHFARTEGKNVSEVVRELLEEYVSNRDIESYIDDLWGRIGGKLASGGTGAEGVKQAIRDVRRNR